MAGGIEQLGMIRGTRPLATEQALLAVPAPIRVLPSTLKLKLAPVLPTASMEPNLSS